LIAVSEAAYEFAYQMFPGDYRLIPNGVELRRFGRPAKIAANARLTGSNKLITLLFVGRLDKRKGFLHLLEAFINLKPAYPHLRLQVVGPFTPRECEPYQQRVQAHGVTDVEFVGYVSPEELPNFYHQADIFCAPALGFESFGIVLLEAMAAGLPIVASDIAGYRSLVTAEQEALLTPPGQPDALATALRRLLDQPYLRQKMGRRGELKASCYSWDCIVDKILDVYLDTVERKTKARCAVLGPIETGLQSSRARPAKIG
jgi:phosphatidylinositol alpha-mannosyltransferase